jgi:hypothetical protein
MVKDANGAGFAEITDRRSFLHCFRGLPDHHQAGKVNCPLPEVLLPILVVVLAGDQAFTDIARFGERKIELPLGFPPNLNGTPPTIISAKFLPCSTPSPSGFG